LKRVDRFLLSREDNGNLGNIFRIGFAPSGTDDGEAAYWDATEGVGEFNVGGTTAPASSLSDNTWYLEIIHDHPAGETHFNLVAGGGAAKYEETISGNAARERFLIYTESTGNNDKVWCSMHTSAWIPGGI
jgi:hypothetical protein